MVAYARDEIISAAELARNVSATLNSITKNQKKDLSINSSKNSKLLWGLAHRLAIKPDTI